jgi:Protein of unknown function (DUF3617)
MTLQLFVSKHRNICLTSSLWLLIASSSPAFAQVTPRAGEWEMTSDMQGLPSGKSTATQKVCMTAEKIGDAPERSLFEAAPSPKDAPEKGGPKCTYSDFVRDGAKSSWLLTCEGPFGSMKGSGGGKVESEYAELTNTFDMKTPLGNRQMQRRVTARRLGECP